MASMWKKRLRCNGFPSIWAIQIIFYTFMWHGIRCRKHEHKQSSPFNTIFFSEYFYMPNTLLNTLAIYFAFVACMWSVLISFSFFAVFAILMRQSKLLLYIYIEWQRIFSLNEHKKDGGGGAIENGQSSMECGKCPEFLFLKAKRRWWWILNVKWCNEYLEQHFQTTKQKNSQIPTNKWIF